VAPLGGVCDAGEFAGFAVPAVVGGLAYAAGAPAVLFLVLLVAAGAVEGAVMGYAQWRAMRPELPVIPPQEWVLATSIAAAVAWTFGMTPSTFFEDGPLAVFIALQVIGVFGIMLSIAIGQWLVLRNYLERAAGRIPATALAWTAGVAWVFVAMSIRPRVRQRYR
jgi:hypothetical protein